MNKLMHRFAAHCVLAVTVFAGLAAYADTGTAGPNAQQLPYAELPIRYVQLVYIESSGSGPKPYIDTGLAATKVCGFEFYFSPLTGQDQYGAPISSSVDNLTLGTWKSNAESIQYYFRYRNDSNTGTMITLPLAGDDPFAYNVIAVRDNQVTANGVYKRDADTSTSVGTDNANLFIFCNAVKQRFACGRFYGFKAYDASGNLIANLVPARDVNGVACVYDTVRKVAIYPRVGAFKMGPVHVDSSALYVAGSPMDYNSNLMPIRYGSVVVNEGDVLTVPAEVEVDGKAMACSGYKLYEYNAENEQYVELTERAGTGTSFTVTADDVGAGRKLEWQWVSMQRRAYAELPGGYVQLAYIESSGSGTKPYINTGLVATKVCGFEFYFSPLTGQDQYGAPISSSEDNLTLGTSSSTAESITYYLRYRQDNNLSTRITLPLAGDDPFAYNVIAVRNNQVTADGVYKRDADTAIGVGTDNASLFIFCNAGFKRYACGRFYGFKAYDAGGNLMADLVPARDVNGVACVYDTVRKVAIYTAAGTFKKGPVLVDSSAFYVTGSPLHANLDTGTAYGKVNVSAGDVLSAPAAVEKDGRVIACSGYKLYEYDDESEQYVELTERAGTGTSFTVTADDVGTGRKLEWQRSVQHLSYAELPSGYVQLAYIESSGSGTKPYIDTGLVDSQVCGIEFYFSPLTGQDKFGAPIASSEDNLTLGTWNPNMEQFTDSIRYYFRYRNDANDKVGFYLPIAGEDQLDYSVISVRDNQMLVNGVLRREVNTAQGVGTGNVHIFLLCNSAKARYARGRIYGLKAYDASGNLIANLVPVRDANNVACLYDTVRETAFRSGAAGGVFKEGPINVEDDTNAFYVDGSPSRAGVAEGVVYGKIKVAAGDVISVPESVQIFNGDEVCDGKYVCVGYKLYEYDSASEEYVENAARAGTDNSFTVTAADVGTGRKLEWQWKDVYKVTAEADPNADGTVSIDVVDGGAGVASATAEAWLATGTKVQITFHPASVGGYRAIKLTSGQPEDMTRPTINTVTFTVEKKNVSFVTGSYDFDDGYLAAEDPAVAVTCLYGDKRRVYAFTNVAVKTLSVFVLRDLTYQESLVLGGGGAGGMWGNSGGGGAGGLVRDSSARLLEKDSRFTLQVGKGGAGSPWHGEPNWTSPAPKSGDNTTLNLAGLSLTALGGGAGNSGYQIPGPGQPGGCGGGGGGGDKGPYDPGKGTPGQGFDGGAYVRLVDVGAGGGGTDDPGKSPAKTAGTDTYHGGNGGDGRLDMITGVMHRYGSGGGGAAGGKTFNGSGDYIDAPGEGGRESGGRAGVEVLPAVNPDGKYTYGGQNGKDGLGGGGGACGNKSGYRSGSGGCGTVILAFTVGDTTAWQFACDNLGIYPIGEMGATPEPVIRNAKTGAALTKDVDYTLDYENNLAEGHAKLVVKGAGVYADVVQRFDFDVTGVRYVTPDAPEDGTGEDWAHPMNLTNAVNGLTNKTYEIWCKAGTYDLSGVPAGLKIPCETAIRGGFAADPIDTLKKDPNGEKTILDGAGVSKLFFDVTYSCGASNFGLKEIVFADCTFTRCKGLAVRSVNKATPFTFTRCDFKNNTADTSYDAIAFYIYGASSAPVSFTDCRFEGNISKVDKLQFVLFFADAKVVMDSCLFVTNIMPLNQARTSFGDFPEPNLIRIENSTAESRISNCDFRGNFLARWTKATRLVYIDNVKTAIENCRFVGNSFWNTRDKYSDRADSIVGIANGSASTPVAIRNCTFAYNALDANGNESSCIRSDGKSPLSVESCIFWQNVTDKLNPAALDFQGPNATVSYCTFAALERGTCVSLDLDGTCTTNNPLFVTQEPIGDYLLTTLEAGRVGLDPAKIDDILAIDVHLLSPEAYTLNDGTRMVQDDAAPLSPAIDAGNPAADFSKEPGKNGGRLNRGGYGNTAEASETPFANPELQRPTVEYDTPYTQPTVVLTMAGDGKFTVPVTVYASEDGETWAEAGTVQMKNGDVKRVRVPRYFPADGKIFLKTSYEFNGAARTASYEPVDVAEGKMTPPWYNVPGLQHVVYLRPGATGLATGDNWTDACTTMRMALILLKDAGKTELWIVGTNILDAATFKKELKQTFNKKIMIRGGFAGSEATAEARIKGALSVLDGANEADGIVFENTSYPIVVENLFFTRMALRGLNLNVKGAAITNCVFSKNGPVGSSDSGRGLYVQSDAFNGAKVVLSGCTFSENIQTHATDQKVDGRASYFKKCNVYMDDCLFVSNGIPFTAGTPNGSARGSAACLEDSSLRATGCRFIANRSRIYNADGCGVVYAPYLEPAYKGHVFCFTNCLFLANEMLGTKDPYDKGCGGVFFQCWQQGATSECVNCTFAYNLSELADAGAGFSTASAGGRLVVKNSIFHGNVNRSGINADINMANVTTAEVTYNYFDSTNNVYGLANTATKVFANNIYGVDPGLISTTNDFYELIKPTVTQTSGGRYFDWTQPEKIMSLNVHLRGKGGYIDETTGEKVAGVKPTSPCVDAGDPKSDYRRETKPRGYRVNMGFYGNTPYQTQTTPGMAVRVR